MLNQAAVEELYSGTYVANYLKIMETLPDALQRQVTLIRELDFRCRESLAEMEVHRQIYMSKTSDQASKRRAIKTIRRCMLQSQELGDEKLNIIGLIIDLIENRSRQLDQDLENLDPNTNREHDKPEEPVAITTKKVDVEKPEKVVQKRQRRQKQELPPKEEEIMEEPDKVSKKRRRRTKKDKEETVSIIDNIDPDEPVYCICEQVSYGEMIGCDNDHCSLEWFHFNCVGLYTKPKGRWYCPNCRGDKASVKRSDLK